MHYGGRANIAQLKVNKARAKLRFATKQYKLAKARLNHQKHAEDTFNITKVRARESLGLTLGEKIQNHGVNKLIKIRNLQFEIALDSATQTLFPVSVSLQTTEAQEKVLKIPMDFGRLEFSITYAANYIVQHFFGKSRERRRKRSTHSLNILNEDVQDNADNSIIHVDNKAA